MSRITPHLRRGYALKLLPLACLAMVAAPAWPQASWVGDVIVDGEPSNLWADCLPCTETSEPPNSNWSTDRIPGDDGPLGDPGTGAVIGPDFVVDHNGGTLDLSTLDVQGSLIVGGLINISDSATINNIDLESGGALAGPAPVNLTGSGTWNGALRSGGGVTNQATLTAETGDLETDLVNEATLLVNPSLQFTATPSTLTNNGNIFLNTDTALNNNSDILDGTDAANLLLNQGTIAKFGADLSVIEAPGDHAGGLISARDGTLRFFRGDWQFSGGGMQVSNAGRIELTGNVDHVINGAPGISGEGSLLVNMNTFGTLTIAEPFTVDLNGSGDHGLLLQGIGIVLENFLTSRRGGQWRAGTISGEFPGRFTNEAPMSDPFEIVPGGSKTLRQAMVSPGWIRQSDNVLVADFAVLSVADGGGLVVAAMPASVDWLGTGHLVNHGTFEVEDGARSSVAIAFAPRDGGSQIVAGELELRGGGYWEGDNQTILQGGGLLTFHSGRFQFGPGTHRILKQDSTRLEPVTIELAELVATAADADVIFDLDFVGMNGGGLGGAGHFENRRHFAWRSGQFGIDGSIDFTNAEGAILAIHNAGNLLDGRLENQGFAYGGLHLTSAAVVYNASEWNVTGSASRNRIGTTDPHSPGRFNNSGELRFDAGTEAQFEVDALLDNTGTVRVGGGATLNLDGPVVQLQDGELTGGTWLLAADASLVFPEGFDTIGPGAVVAGVQGIDGVEALTRILGGEAVVTGQLTLDGGLLLENGAQVTFDGASTTNAPGGVQNGSPGSSGSVAEMLEEDLVISLVPPGSSDAAGAGSSPTPARGVGTPLLITPLFDSHAIMAPGGLGLPGPFNLDGDLVMHPGSTLAIDINGAAPIEEYDRLSVTGSMQLGGTLELTVAEDFEPAIGQQFVIATSSGTTGAFDQLVQANRTDLVWSISRAADEVILTLADVVIFSDGFE